MPIPFPPTAVFTAETNLRNRGVSPLGVWQLMSGLIITDPKDRQRIARMIHAEKNQDIEVENDETHWVGHNRGVVAERTETVDKDERITIHSNRTESLRRAGLSLIGTMQVFSYQPITDPADREKLAIAIVRQIAKAS
jgi:type VI secretion system secreted protein VgrG